MLIMYVVWTAVIQPLFFCCLKAAVTRVLGRVSTSDKYKIQAALKLFKAKLSECRSEEKQKVNWQWSFTLLYALVIFVIRFWAMLHTHQPAIYLPESWHGKLCNRCTPLMTSKKKVIYGT